MTKDTQVLNANATNFEILLHASERKEQNEAQMGTREVFQRSVLFEEMG